MMWLVRRAILTLAVVVTAAACTAETSTFSTSPPVLSVPPSASASAAPLLRGGESFGECFGYCGWELIVRADGRVVLELSRWGERPRTIRNQGILSPDALERAQVIVAQLGGVSRDEIYGCPDRTDGGASHVQTWAGGRPVRSAYEFGRPPATLVHADLTVLIDTLDRCAGTDTVTIGPGCTPRPEE